MANCDARQIMEVASCWSCLDQRQTMSAVLAVLCQINQAINPMATCDVNSIMARSACWSCLSGNQYMSAMLQLLCEILVAGGGGEVCNICAEHDPDVASACDCGHWTNTATGEMWYWRALTATWVKYISNS